VGLNVFLVGLGLIGGSLGLALKESPLLNSIMGFDINHETIKKAIDIGSIDMSVGLREGTGKADIIFLCTPLGSYASILGEIMPALRPGTIISDVGSTKKEVMKLFQQLPEQVWGIGGHPMAGSEIKGINGADRYLFENAIYGLTPDENTPEEKVNLLVDLLKITGARIKMMDAARHDELVATVSHIPHLAAVALVNLTEGADENLMMAAGGFRDTTRIASSNPEIWNDILFFNRDHIVDKLDTFIAHLQTLREALANNNTDSINQELYCAKEIRDKIPQVRRGLLPSFNDIVCIVPDNPGIIGQLGFILGQEGINIVDIEILRAREGDGGTIRLGVPSKENAYKAVRVLQSHDITAWVR